MSTYFIFVCSIQSEQNAMSTCFLNSHLSAPPVTVLFKCTVPHLSLSLDVNTSQVMFILLATSLNIKHSIPLTKPIFYNYSKLLLWNKLQFTVDRQIETICILYIYLFSLRVPKYLRYTL